QSNLRFNFLVALLVAALCAASVQSLARTRSQSYARTTTNLAQYDDPYSDYRNARYSNAGLLSERDEIKLGAQLHREVTKKYNLTDVGLDRVDRIGQRCVRASLRPTLVYKFHVIQGREINGFSL